MRALRSWRTTIAGLAVLAGGIYLVVIGKTVEGGIIIAAGLGLLGAKDFNVTGTGRNG